MYKQLECEDIQYDLDSIKMWKRRECSSNSKVFDPR